MFRPRFGSHGGVEIKDRLSEHLFLGIAKPSAGGLVRVDQATIVSNPMDQSAAWSTVAWVS